jgi:hypothetical protein
VKIFYSESSLFIGARVAVSRTRLDSTVARFPEDACPLWHSEGDVFLLKFKGFRGIGSSESTRFPEGLVLGNSGKTCHPRNVGFDENHEISFQGGWFYEDLESWTCEALKSRTCEDLKSWICKALKSRTCEDRESWTCESWSCESVKTRSHEPAKLWSHEPAKLWNRDLWNSGIYWSPNSEVMAHKDFHE